jgi:hypothetical protein
MPPPRKICSIRAVRHIQEEVCRFLSTPLTLSAPSPTLFVYLTHHKVRIYKEYHSVCPLVGTWFLPTPLSPASVPLPIEPEGRHTRLRVRGWGSPNSDDLRKSLGLCLLCVTQKPDPLSLTVFFYFLFITEAEFMI